MSEKPLFQDSDEQESIYTGERVPGSGPVEPATDAGKSRIRDGNLADPGLIPGAVATGANIGGTGPSTGTGTLSGVAPIAGGAGLTDMIDDDDTKHRNDTEA